MKVSLLPLLLHSYSSCMLALVLRTKWAAAFRSIHHVRTSEQSTASRLLSSTSSSSLPEQPHRRRPAHFDTLEDQVGLSGAYDYEPDIAEME